MIQKYFVYGALMTSKHLSKPCKAKLIDYQVQFVVKGPSRLEPAFAGLIEQQGEVAWGILAEMPLLTWQAISRHEVSYQEATVQVMTTDGQNHSCITLIPKVTLLPQKTAPSARYARKLYLSSRKFQFPAQTIHHYKQHYQNGPKTTLYMRWSTPIVKKLVPHMPAKWAFIIGAFIIPGIGIILCILLLYCIYQWIK